MTVRRDLDELENRASCCVSMEGLKVFPTLLDQELSHTEKATLQIQEKEIAAHSSLLDSRGRNDFLRTRYNNRTSGDAFY